MVTHCLVDLSLSNARFVSYNDLTLPLVRLADIIACDQISQAFSPRSCILQVIKNWSRGPGNEANIFWLQMCQFSPQSRMGMSMQWERMDWCVYFVSWRYFPSLFLIDKSLSLCFYLRRTKINCLFYLCFYKCCFCFQWDKLYIKDVEKHRFCKRFSLVLKIEFDWSLGRHTHTSDLFDGENGGRWNGWQLLGVKSWLVQAVLSVTMTTRQPPAL